MKNIKEVAKNAYDKNTNDSGAKFTQLSAKEQALYIDCVDVLSKVVSDDYLQDVCNDMLISIADDVKECSAYKNEGCWSAEDIRMAIGRTLQMLGKVFAI